MLVRSFTFFFGVVLSFAVMPARADFKELLASRLGADAEFLVLNIPPRPGAWPGAIFTDDMRIPIVRGKADDPALVRGESTSIDAINMVDLSAGAKASWATLFSFAAKAGDIAHVTMHFPDVTIIDLDYQEIKKRIQETPSVVQAAKRGRIPIIITKSYEGTPTLTLLRKAEATASAWADIKKAAVEAKLEAGVINEDRVTYKSSNKIIFAFEIMQANYDFAILNDKKLPVDWAVTKAPSYIFLGYEVADKLKKQPRDPLRDATISVIDFGFTSTESSEIRSMCSKFGRACVFTK